MRRVCDFESRPSALQFNENACSHFELFGIINKISKKKRVLIFESKEKVEKTR